MKRKHVWFSVIAFIATLIGVIFYIIAYVLNPGASYLPCLRVVLSVLWALWTIGPPIWFLYEWHTFKFSTGIFVKEEFDPLKHSQDLAKNLWAGVVAILGLFLLKFS